MNLLENDMKLETKTYEKKKYNRFDERKQEIKYLLQTINRPDHAEQYKRTWGVTPYERLRALEISDS